MRVYRYEDFKKEEAGQCICKQQTFRDKHLTQRSMHQDLDDISVLCSSNSVPCQV